MSNSDLHIQESKNMIFSLLPVGIWKRFYNFFIYKADWHKVLCYNSLEQVVIIPDKQEMRGLEYVLYMRQN